MRSRRGTAEQELQALEERLTKLASDLERQEAAIDDARAAVMEARQLEASAELDDQDPSAAKKRRIDAEAALVDATDDLDVLRRKIAELDRRIEDQREAVRQEQVAGALEALQQGLAADVDASKGFAAALKQACVRERALLDARENVKTLRAKVAELGGDSFEHDADEAEWPDVRALVEFLSSGKPLRPIEAEERAARKRAFEEENAPRAARIVALDKTRAFAATSWRDPVEQERNRVVFFAQQVPDEVRDEAIALYEQIRSELASRPRARI